MDPRFGPWVILAPILMLNQKLANFGPSSGEIESHFSVQMHEWGCKGKILWIIDHMGRLLTFRPGPLWIQAWCTKSLRFLRPTKRWIAYQRTWPSAAPGTGLVSGTGIACLRTWPSAVPGMGMVGGTSIAYLRTWPSAAPGTGMVGGTGRPLRVRSQAGRRASAPAPTGSLHS